MPDRTFTTAWNAAHEAVSISDVQLLQQYGLTGVGVGLKVIAGQRTDEPCVKAYVRRKLAIESLAPSRVLPKLFVTSTMAVSTDVEEMLTPSAPPWNAPPTQALSSIGGSLRRRPLHGGDSISHFTVPTGTVAIAVRDPNRPWESLVLSCNHVLAALNRGRRGDVILQPARGDGGQIPRDVCGTLDRFVPVRFESLAANEVDAAVARVPNSGPSIDWIGLLAGVRPAETLVAGELVFKVGRTTGLTAGRVEATRFSGWIPYPPTLGGGIALFKNQILTSSMAAFGDSGAVLVDAELNGIGLLFGGSSTHTLYNDLKRVLSKLAVRARVRTKSGAFGTLLGES